MAERLLGHSYSDVRLSGLARAHLGDVHHHYQENLRADILRWLDAPDHTSNHSSARKKREEGTGLWITETPSYKDWLAGNVPVLWLHGKAGSCKTVLCSAIIDNINDRFANQLDRTLIYFYFSFADTAKQKYKDLLLSLIAQLLREGADCEVLRSAYDGNQMHVSVLEPILCAMLETRGAVHIVIDALDECPEESCTREEMLDGIQALHDRCPTVRLLLTSRKEADISERMDEMSASISSIPTQKVNQDVRTYVAREISRDRKLKKLDTVIKLEIESTICAKADGMFRWAFCQLDHIKRLKIRTNEFIRATLHELPQTLDETYCRILVAIDPRYQEQVVAILQWIAFVDSPLQLDEVVEICVTHTDSKPYVREDDRGAWVPGIVDVLSAMVQLVRRRRYHPDRLDGIAFGAQMTVPSLMDPEDLTSTIHMPSQDPMSWGRSNKPAPVMDGDSYETSEVDLLSEVSLKDVYVVLAHFSVKEYLLSDRIRASVVSNFALEQHIAAYDRAQRSIAYILHVEAYCTALMASWSSPTQPEQDKEALLGDLISCDEDLIKDSYPLFFRAVRRWNTWQRQAEVASGDKPMPGLELVLLRNDDPPSTWCEFRDLFSADRFLNSDKDPNDVHGESSAKPLHMACILQLPRTVARFCDMNADAVNASCGYLGYPLIRASAKGFTDIVEVLLAAGAIVDCQDGPNTALCYAADHGHVDVVRLLLKAGANVNHNLLRGQTPLQAAAMERHIDIVGKLIEAGADLNAQTQGYPSALHFAARTHQNDIMSLLIREGADVNLQAPMTFVVPLQEALQEEFDAIPTLQLLLDASADASIMQPVCVSKIETLNFLHEHGATSVWLHTDPIHCDAAGPPCTGRMSELPGGYTYEYATVQRPATDEAGTPKAAVSTSQATHPR